MTQPPESISCPSCRVDLPATLAVTDGGSTDEADTLYGETLRCGDCGAEFEVLFYPR